jgi:hypothetical protein
VLHEEGVVVAKAAPLPPHAVPTYLDLCREGFEAGDPWRAWEAYNLAACYKLPIPPWVGAYLERVAAGLTQLSLDVDPPTGDRLLRAVTRTLGLTVTGRGALTRRRETVARNAALATDVALLVAAGHDLYLAAECASTFHGVRKTTAYNAYKAAQARGDPRLDNLQGMLVPPEVVLAQAWQQPGARITGVHYPGEPLRTWRVVRIDSVDGGQLLRVWTRLEAPAPLLQNPPPQRRRSRRTT